MTDMRVSLDPGNLPQLPRPATEPWKAKNPSRTAKITVASVTPILLTIALALLFQIDYAIAAILVFLPLQIDRKSVV